VEYEIRKGLEHGFWGMWFVRIVLRIIYFGMKSNGSSG
jgi:hypothetical protein